MTYNLNTDLHKNTTGCLVSVLLDQPISYSNDHTINRSHYQSVNQLFNPSINQFSLSTDRTLKDGTISAFPYNY